MDLWIGTADAGVARLLLPVLAPKAYLPVHWDGLYGAFEAGVPRRMRMPASRRCSPRPKCTLLRPAQYMDKWRLSRDGVRPIPNDAVKKALGF